MPFITELPPKPPPPPLEGLSMMNGMQRAMEGGEGLGLGLQEELEEEWRWEQERELMLERQRRVEHIVGRSGGGGRIRPGRGTLLRAVRRFEEIEDEVYPGENVEDEAYVGENMEVIRESEQQQQRQEVLKSESEARLEQKELELVCESTVAVEGKVQVEEQPVRSRKENRLARKERRMKKKLEELEALEGSEGAQDVTKGALHLSQHQKKALFGRKNIEGQVKAQVFKRVKELASDPAIPPPLLPVRGTLPTPPEKVKQVNVAQPQARARDGKADAQACIKAQAFKKMERHSLDPVTYTQLLPVRGARPKPPKEAKPAKPKPSIDKERRAVKRGLTGPELERPKYKGSWALPTIDSPPPAKPKPSTDKRFMDRAERRAVKRGLTGPELERPKYKGSWALPTIDSPPPPSPKPKKAAAIPPVLRSLVGAKPTPESILRNPRDYPSWAVQKAALQAKFKGTPWQARKRISPGMVTLLKAINAEAPHVLKAQQIAAKFKISPEAARRILGSKRVMSDEEKERKMMKWIERGRRIRSANIESGEIWTKEKRKKVWEVKEKWRKIKEMTERFGIKVGKKKGEGVEVERSLGRISWERKFV